MQITDFISESYLKKNPYNTGHGTLTVGHQSVDLQKFIKMASVARQSVVLGDFGCPI